MGFDEVGGGLYHSGSMWARQILVVKKIRRNKMALCSDESVTVSQENRNSSDPSVVPERSSLRTQHLHRHQLSLRPVSKLCNLIAHMFPMLPSGLHSWL